MRITKQDACQILGVKEDSSPDEVRSSYKRLALKWHPDKHGDSHISKDEATQKFQEVSAAYKRLTTNVNDNDDEIDDSEFMNIREMMELFAHIFFHNGVRGCPHHGMDCCDYDEDEYFYSDEEYYDYTDEESDDEFLDTIAHRLRNKYEARKYMTKDKIQTQHQSLTEEEALRNARELIEEEELEKKREEKKRAKRKKKKEKKKLREKEKKEQELIIKKGKLQEQHIQNIENTIDSQNKENSNPKESLKSDPNVKQSTKSISVNDSGGVVTNCKQSSKSDNKKTISTNGGTKNNQSNKKDNNTDKRNKNSKNHGSDSDEDPIDINSAFFAHAASKAPLSHNGTSISPTDNNKKESSLLLNKKKKNNNQQQQQLQSKKAKKQNSNNTENNSNTECNDKKNISTNSSLSQNMNEKNTSSTPIVNGTHHHEAIIKNNIDVVILQSRQIAVQGNQLAQTGDYHGAVKMFSKAIRLDQTDFRFFGNRSYCYDRIEEYEKALEDADAAIRLAPEWPKGHFRKGRSLTGLKRFQEAEQVFQQVLKLDPGCEDAQFELARVRVQILVDMGFTQHLSEQAVRTYGTVQQALEALLAGKVSDEESSEEVYFSEEDEYENIPATDVIQNNVQNNNSDNNNKKSTTTIKQPVRQSEPKCTALWVGNVDPQMVTEKQMANLFGKCGKVTSVRILPHKYCAFVNYDAHSAAAMAMEKLQGAALGNQKLLLRFPNNPPPGSFVPESQTAVTTTITTNNTKSTSKSSSVSESSNDSSKLSGPVNGNECYFWRTTGCVFENQCRYKHVRGHKGVDLPKVQAKYGKIPIS